MAYFEQDNVLQDLNDVRRHEMLATVAYPRQVSPPSPELPPTVNYQPPPSTSVDLPKPKHKLKILLLWGGAILLLSLGGYGVWQISKPLSAKTVAYEKLALANSLTGHSDWIHSLAICADGQTLVSGSGDNSIKVWNLQTGALKTTLSLHSDAINSVAISRGGKTVVSGSKDGTIKIWNLQTGALKNTLTGHSDLVYTVAISPDGKTLVSGSKDNTIKIWRVP